MNKYDLELRRKISKKLREEMNTAEPSQPTGQTEIELYGDKFKIIGKNGWGEL